MMKKGLVQIYTGNGKGKTTAALGQGLRAIGHGLKVIMIQFMKGKIDYGELKAVRKLKNFKIEQYGLPTFVDRDRPSAKDLALAQKGFQRASEVIISGKYDIIILDEINVAIDYGLIKLSEVLNLIKQKPKGVELILTGRYAPAELLDVADLVSEILEVKHYFQKGLKPRKGIEY
ncbi:MAG: cob(I)yrinic acid a,c-diamide adenosyltransferase [candidate division WOR-3 bacterium]